MKIAQIKLINNNWEKFNNDIKPQLCLLFGNRFTIEKNLHAISELKTKFPDSNIVTTSTAGSIIDEHLIDDSIIATCIEFEKTNIIAQSFSFDDFSGEQLGKNIAKAFKSENLKYLLVLSNMGVNAGNILNGINEIFEGKVLVSGGVAGDDNRFEKTLVGLNNNITNNQIVAVGFYGNDIKISHGSKGGWDTFGPIRKITKCLGNQLFEVDHKPVLNLYKEYLGDKAKDLPASGLLYPFTIIDKNSNEPIVRGIQNIDEKTNSILLYGDVIEGQNIQLMRANFNNLINGAGHSAKETFLNNKNEPELALLISCVARRLVLKQLTEEELIETKKVLGNTVKICGFYSYSELSPVVGNNACQLHNQTMTITTFSEN